MVRAGIAVCGGRRSEILWPDDSGLWMTSRVKGKNDHAAVWVAAWAILPVWGGALLFDGGGFAGVQILQRGDIYRVAGHGANAAGGGAGGG